MSQLTIGGRVIGELRVIDLKEELDKRGLSKSGNKSALLERLEEALLLEQQSNGGEKTMSESVLLHDDSPDVVAAPNVAMKDCGNEVVAEYLMKQQEALQCAKKAKEQAVAVSSDASDADGTTTGEEKFEELPAIENSSMEPNAGGSRKSGGGGSGESSPRSADSSSPRREMAVDEGESRSRPRRDSVQKDEDSSQSSDSGESEVEEDKGPEAGEKQHTKQTTQNEPPVELGESAAADDEVEIAAPPESVEEMIADHQSSKMAVGRSTGDSKETGQHPEMEVAEQQKEKHQRKRKWGKTRIGKRGAIAISSDSLKDIVGSVKEVVEETLPEHKVELDYDEEQPENKRIVISQDVSEEKEDRKRESPVVKRIVVEEPGEEVVINKEPDVPTESLTEEGLIRCKSVSPARYPVNQVIHIRCLTRPFTVKQLQDLLSTFGKFNKKDFWIDNIKSNCVVKFDTVEQAEKARSGLHNVKWPAGNPKLLRVDFASQDVLDRHFRGVGASENVEKENNVEQQPRKKDNKEERKVRSRSKERREKRRSRSPHKSADVWPRDREWDKGKTWESGQSPPRQEQRRQRRRSPSGDRIRDSAAWSFEQKPAKLLDDLFRKTKTTPCIYWLPLTEDEIRNRELVKKRQEKERAENLQKMRRLEEEERAVRRRDPYEHDDRVQGRNRRRSSTPDRYRRR